MILLGVLDDEPRARRSSPFRLAWILPAALALWPSTVSSQTIWVEGEKPFRSSVSRHPWWYDQVKKSQLSGGDSISHWSDDKDGIAEYVLSVPSAARYTF